MDWAFEYVESKGISKLADYPYVGKNEKCKSISNTAGLKLTGFVDLQINEERIKEAVGKYFLYLHIMLFLSWQLPVWYNKQFNELIKISSPDKLKNLLKCLSY